MSLAFRMISALTIPPLYRLGERSKALRGRRLRGRVMAAMEWLSRSSADAARDALEIADDQPDYLNPELLPAMIEHYARRKTRADRRAPDEKAKARADE